MKFLIRTLLLALALALGLAPQAAAQGPGAAQRPAGPGSPPGLERSAAADARAVVTLCVENGDVLVRGWDRGEVRVRAEEAGTLTLLTPNVSPAPRVEVLVSEDEGRELRPGECGTSRRIELTVPRGATVSVQSNSGHVEVSDVAEARVKVLSGDVNVRRVSQSVEVSCLSGDVTGTDSSGSVRASTVSGDVEARGLRTSAEGDNLEAKSVSGDVTVEGVAHRQVSASAVSGQVLYTGAITRGGSYDFKTISGDVTLELPADSSFNLHAKVVVSGEIDTDFPVRTVHGAAHSARTAPPAPPPTPSPSPNGPGIVVMPPDPPAHGKPGKGKVKVKGPREHTSAQLDGTVGAGDAVVNLNSFSGSLRLRKR